MNSNGTHKEVRREALTMSPEDTQEEADQTDTTDFDEDIERMAKARAEIEDSLAERQSELAKIGEFDQATCTEFGHKRTVSASVAFMANESTDSGLLGRQRNQSNSSSVGGRVVFTYRLPDGETTTREFDIEDEAESLQSFLDAHGADSVTEMVGAKHAAIYTNGGWKLWRSPNAREWLYWPRVNEDGSFMMSFWPAIPLFVTGFGLFIWDAVSVRYHADGREHGN